MVRVHEERPEDDEITAGDGFGKQEVCVAKLTIGDLSGRCWQIYSEDHIAALNASGRAA